MMGPVAGVYRRWAATGPPSGTAKIVLFERLEKPSIDATGARIAQPAVASLGINQRERCPSRMSTPSSVHLWNPPEVAVCVFTPSVAIWPHQLVNRHPKTLKAMGHRHTAQNRFFLTQVEPGRRSAGTPLFERGESQSVLERAVRRQEVERPGGPTGPTEDMLEGGQGGRRV
jgi:hypothetical protein